MSTSNLDSADLKSAGFGGLIREDVMNKIWDISKIPLPLTDKIGTDTAKNSYKEWTEDALQPPNLNNAVVDGTDTTGNDAVVGQRIGNHCQTSVKVVQVSQRAKDSAVIGRSNELAYQVMRRQQELRRDVEAIMLSGQGSVADNGSTTAGKSAGLNAIIHTTANRGTGGAAPGFNASTGLVPSATDGTKRGLTETMVRDAVEGVYNQGGNASVLMTIPSVCRKFSEYLFSSPTVARIQNEYEESTAKAAAMGAVNVFVSDFGTLTLEANRLQQKTGLNDAASVFVLDTDYLAVAYLTGYKTTPLAKTGLADKRLMSVDWTLMFMNEKSQAVIADIDPTVAVTQ